MKINKTVLGVAAASMMAVTSVVYAQFSLINGGGGWGYGYGYGVGFGTDNGLYSYRTTGPSADQYAYGYGYVSNTSNVTSTGSGGSYSGGVVFAGYPTGTSNNPSNVGTIGGTCSPIFNVNMRARIWNSNEVRKLQVFLNKYMGENLPVTGNFLGMTTAAVNRFQAKYASEILSPVGSTRPTNNFYSYSRAKANAIYCANPMNLGY